MGHHPDLSISWDTVTVSLSTHSEGGLTANDFELAAKIDALLGAASASAADQRSAAGAAGVLLRVVTGERGAGEARGGEQRPEQRRASSSQLAPSGSR